MSSFFSKLSIGMGALSSVSIFHSFYQLTACDQCQNLINHVKKSLKGAGAASVEEKISSLFKATSAFLMKTASKDEIQRMGTNFLKPGEIRVHSPCSDFLDVQESDLGCDKYLLRMIVATAVIAGCMGLYLYTRKSTKHRLLAHRDLLQQEVQVRQIPTAPKRTPTKTEFVTTEVPISAQVRNDVIDPEEANKKLQKEWDQIKNRWKKTDSRKLV